MLTGSMERLTLFAWLGLMAPGCAKPRTESVQSGDLAVEVHIHPDPPTTGENHLLLRVADAAGKPVDGAKIDFAAAMPAMGAMPAMTGGGEVKALGGGHYEVTYPLAMSATWTLTVRLEAAGHPTAELRLRVAPAQKGFTVEGGGVAGGPGGAPDGGKLLEIPPARQQLIGVTYGTVEQRPLSLTLRAPARVEVDETRLSEVTLKYDAYVEKLFASQTGQAVKKGEPLLTVYSPELFTAQRDLLLARRNLAAGTLAAKALVHAAEERLRLWNLVPAQIAQLEELGQAAPRATLLSPASGVVLEKNVVEGSRAMAGSVLYRIGNLGRIWVLADLYEWDAPYLAVGQPATMTLSARTGQAWRGAVQLIYPTVDEKTRSVRARLAFENTALALKPGMYADVTIDVPLGIRLAVPDSALLVSGEHRYAFVERGPGKLQPVEVEIGAMTPGFDEVRAGLKEGDRVATGATFLLSSEAQLQGALPRWGAP